MSFIVCHLSHSCTLLKPFNGFRCHLAAATLVGSYDTLFWMGIPNPKRKGRFGVKPLLKTCNCKLLPPPGKYQRGVIQPSAKLLWSSFSNLACRQTQVKAYLPSIDRRNN